MTIEKTYFFSVISMSNILEWDEVGEVCQPNRYLLKLIEVLNVELDLPALYDRYFETVRVGHGDVFLYKEHSNATNLVAFDLFKEPSDQLDLIRLAICCDNDILNVVRTNIRAFYDMAECKICLEESIISCNVLDMIDESNYPKDIEKSNFRQRIHLKFKDCLS